MGLEPEDPYEFAALSGFVSGAQQVEAMGLGALAPSLQLRSKVSLLMTNKCNSKPLLAPYSFLVQTFIQVFGSFHPNRIYGFEGGATQREHELSLVCLSRKSWSTVSALGPSPGKQQARKT
jgi:hypothetical protein